MKQVIGGTPNHERTPKISAEYVSEIIGKLQTEAPILLAERRCCDRLGGAFFGSSGCHKTGCNKKGGVCKCKRPPNKRRQAQSFRLCEIQMGPRQNADKRAQMRANAANSRKIKELHPPPLTHPFLQQFKVCSLPLNSHGDVLARGQTPKLRQTS